MMFVIAAFCLLSSFCCIGLGTVVPQLISERPELFSQLQQDIPNATPDLIRLIMFVMGGAMVVVGILLIVLGFFVRRGGKTSIILSLVAAVILMLLFLANTVSTAFRATKAPPPQGILAMCFMIVPLVMVGLLIMWLIQAVRVEAPNPYQQQYFPYGYPPPPPPPPGNPYTMYTPPPPPGGGVTPRYPGYTPPAPPPLPPPPRGPDDGPPT
jgi:vacuolar-type H+-ATPase subunit I/STV1